MEKKNIFTIKKLNTALKIRPLKCYVWATLMYECEGWTLNASCRKELEAVETWLHRRIMRVSWVKKLSNQKVLQMVKWREVCC